MKENIVFSGVVIHGKQLGRTIGYPTVNIALAPGIVTDGVYALDILFGGTHYRGVGTYREKVELFEAHIFGYEGDLYDLNLIVTLNRRIRDNQKFDSLQDLKMQIAKDAEAAKK